MNKTTSIRYCVAAMICFAACVGHADAEKTIADLKKQIESLETELAERNSASSNFEIMYYDERAKVSEMRDELEEMKSKYVPIEKLLGQLAFYRAAAATNAYILAQSTNVLSTTILRLERDKGEGGGDGEDADAKFYKKAQLVSKIEFVPLRLYRVTDGKETRWLVYTPPKDTFLIGGLPYPAIEAHGGDWVELDIRGPRDDGKDITVYGYEDSHGDMHIGTKLPSGTLRSFVIARFEASEDEEGD